MLIYTFSNRLYHKERKYRVTSNLQCLTEDVLPKLDSWILPAGQTAWRLYITLSTASEYASGIKLAASTSDAAKEPTVL